MAAIPDPVALIDQLLRYLDSPITDENRGQIQDAVRLIREDVTQAHGLMWMQAYEAGYDRGEADAMKTVYAPTPIRLAMDGLLEQLAEDLASGRAQAH